MRRFHSSAPAPLRSSPPRRFSFPHFPLLPVVFLSLLLVFVLFLVFFSSSLSRPFFSIDSIAQCVDVNRDTYNLSPAIFSDLPPLPACFSTIVSAYHSGQFTDTSFFSREYFLQPEFYPNFSSQGLLAWTQPLYTHYGATGYGAYPNYHSHSFSPENSSPVSIPFFVFAGFGVRSLQQMTLVVRFENPSDADYFSAQLDDSSQNGFILGPTFPKFSSDWVHPVTLTLSPRSISHARPVTVFVRTVRTTSLLEDSRGEYLSFFDSVDYTGERDIFRVIIAPSP